MPRPGKYAHVTAKLEKTFGTDARYQDKVEMVKNELANEAKLDVNDIPTLAKEYLRLRDVKDEIAAQLYDANLHLEAVTQLLSTQCDARDVKHIQIGAQPVYYRLTPYARVADSEAFRLWCLSDADLSRKMTLPWATINSLTAQRLAAGEPEPPGVTVFAKPHFTRGAE